MTALSADFRECSILIYDAAGNYLGSTVVTEYDKSALRIEVEALPRILYPGNSCRLLILTAPSPCEFQGRVIKEGAKILLAMYQGQEMENRGAVRYKINFPAFIENLIYNGKAYPLLTPLKVELVNISKSGVRFNAQPYSLIEEDRFQTRLRIGDGEKLLIAIVKNHLDKFDNSSEKAEYGCQFLIGG